MLSTLVLELALHVAPDGYVNITEQQLDQYVAQHIKLTHHYAMPGLFSADVNMSNMKVALARQTSNQAEVNGAGEFILTLPNRAPIDGILSARFSATPRYAAGQGAIYLERFQLLDYTLQPASLQQQVAVLMPYLLQGLQSRLASRPAYQLDNKDPQQLWLRQHITSFEMQPGILRLKTRS